MRNCLFLLLLFTQCTHAPLYELKVEQGFGSGIYEVGTAVSIAPQLDGALRFVAWEGAAEVLQQPLLAAQVFNMPAKDLSLLAYGLPIGQFSFKYEILPIFRQNCALNGCHLDSNRLTNFTDYASVTVSFSKIQQYLNSGFMPLNRVIAAADKNAILSWIESGMPNN
jgi:hypothetical protein